MLLLLLNHGLHSRIVQQIAGLDGTDFHIGLRLQRFINDSR